MLLAQRNGRISQEHAKASLEALKVLLESNIKIIGDQKEMMDESLDLAARYGITVYDAIYVILAKELGAELLTKDEKQAEVARGEGIKLGAIITK